MSKSWPVVPIACCALLGCKSLPPGTHVAGPSVPLQPGEVQLLLDRTAWNPEAEERVIRQEIFDGLLTMIREAHSSIVLDLFLWNSMGTGTDTHRALSHELCEALCRRKAADPTLRILVLTDPINALYGLALDPELQRLRDAEIPVVLTDLDRLRDSHALYAPPARSASWILKHIPHPEGFVQSPRISNPFDPQAPKLSYQQVGRLLYFKANHRKVALIDRPDGSWSVMVMSFNPHDASSAHSNIALQLEGPVARDALDSELACIEWSAAILADAGERARVAFLLRSIREGLPPRSERPEQPGPRAQWLTERAIRDGIIAICEKAAPPGEIRIALFYLSERHVIRAIRKAALRGVRIRLILDQNRDAFGRRKNGVPNRIVARELMRLAQRKKLDLEVRWADTHGEQFHTKAICLRQEDGSGDLLCGSANWTRRNLNNLNMEACIHLEDEPETLARFCTTFDEAWENRGGLDYTLPYASHAEGWWGALWKGWLYRLGEYLGSSTF